VDQPLEVRLGVLGPFEVTADGRAVEVRSGRFVPCWRHCWSRPAGRCRSTIWGERLWPDRTPVRVRATVHTYVARLRGLLGHDLSARRWMAHT
jgi:DNA-binding SARP family transcriptional activator